MENGVVLTYRYMWVFMKLGLVVLAKVHYQEVLGNLRYALAKLYFSIIMKIFYFVRIDIKNIFEIGNRYISSIISWRMGITS